MSCGAQPADPNRVNQPIVTTPAQNRDPNLLAKGIYATARGANNSLRALGWGPFADGFQLGREALHDFGVYVGKTLAPKSTAKWSYSPGKAFVDKYERTDKTADTTPPYKFFPNHKKRVPVYKRKSAEKIFTEANIKKQGRDKEKTSRLGAHYFIRALEISIGKPGDHLFYEVTSTALGILALSVATPIRWSGKALVVIAKGTTWPVRFSFDRLLWTPIILWGRKQIAKGALSEIKKPLSKDEESLVDQLKTQKLNAEKLTENAMNSKKQIDETAQEIEVWDAIIDLNEETVNTKTQQKDDQINELSQQLEKAQEELNALENEFAEYETQVELDEQQCWQNNGWVEDGINVEGLSEENAQKAKDNLLILADNSKLRLEKHQSQQENLRLLVEDKTTRVKDLEKQITEIQQSFELELNETESSLKEANDALLDTKDLRDTAIKTLEGEIHEGYEAEINNLNLPNNQAELIAAKGVAEKVDSQAIEAIEATKVYLKALETRCNKRHHNIATDDNPVRDSYDRVQELKVALNLFRVNYEATHSDDIMNQNVMDVIITLKNNLPFRSEQTPIAFEKVSRAVNSIATLAMKYDFLAHNEDLWREIEAIYTLSEDIFYNLMMRTQSENNLKTASLQSMRTKQWLDANIHKHKVLGTLDSYLKEVQRMVEAYDDPLSPERIGRMGESWVEIDLAAKARDEKKRDKIQEEIDKYEKTDLAKLKLRIKELNELIDLKNNLVSLSTETEMTEEGTNQKDDLEQRIGNLEKTEARQEIGISLAKERSLCLSLNGGKPFSKERMKKELEKAEKRLRTLEEKNLSEYERAQRKTQEMENLLKKLKDDNTTLKRKTETLETEIKNLKDKTDRSDEEKVTLKDKEKELNNTKKVSLDKKIEQTEKELTKAQKNQMKLDPRNYFIKDLEQFIREERDLETDSVPKILWQFFKAQEMLEEAKEYQKEAQSLSSLCDEFIKIDTAAS